MKCVVYIGLYIDVPALDGSFSVVPYTLISVYKSLSEEVKTDKYIDI